MFVHHLHILVRHLYTDLRIILDGCGKLLLSKKAPTDWGQGFLRCSEGGARTPDLRIMNPAL